MSDAIDTFIHALVELGSDPPEPGAVLTGDMSTDEVLVAMLTENTGRHMLDSGGAYGRSWERNQGLDVQAFRMREPAVLDRYCGLTIDVFHFLSDRLDFDADMDAIWETFCEFPENVNEGWLPLMEAFPAYLDSLVDADGEPIFGCNDDEVCTINTYNGEDALTQTLQFTLFSMEGHEAVYGEWVLLQIHGGADVRGGYTRPRLFRTGECTLLDNARGTLVCTTPEPMSIPVTLDGATIEAVQHLWDTDDGGCTWHDVGNSSTRIPDLGDSRYHRNSIDFPEPDDDGIWHCLIEGCNGTLSVHEWPAG